MDKLRVFTAFTGVGSQEMALRNIGANFEVVGIMEVDKYAILAYDAIHNEQVEVELKTKEEMLEEIKHRNIAFNFSNGKSEIPKSEKELRKLYNAHIRSKNFGDITKINVEELPNFDLFTYSFPCKNISIAGLQGGLEEGSGTQSSLVWECRKIIEHKRPKYLLMENVKNLVSKKHKPHFDRWCETLEELGYVNYWEVLNGKNFNVPQNRERVMMVSIRKDLGQDFKMPIGGDSGIRLKDILEKEVDEKFYINNARTDKLIKEYKGKEDVKIGYCYRSRDFKQQGWRDICPTLCARDYKDPKNVLLAETVNSNKILKIDIPQIVRVRKFDVDIEKLKVVLRESKNKTNLSNRKIAEILNQPLTLVEHWFRTDNCFSIPSDDIWYDLKKLLNIETDEFDLSITTFEEREGVFEKANRCYFDDGISPTLTTQEGDISVISTEPKLNVVGSLKGCGEPWDSRHESSCRVYGTDGLCPTINTCKGGGIEPKILEETFSPKRIGGLYDDDGRRHQAGSVWDKHNICATLDTCQGGHREPCIIDESIDEPKYRIRKIIPLEAWLLMGFTREDFLKAQNVGLSNSKLYERAGRGIVVPMLESIFKNLLMGE